MPAFRRAGVTAGLRSAVWMVLLLAGGCGATDDTADQFVRDTLPDGTVLSRSLVDRPETLAAEEVFASGQRGIEFGRITALAVDAYDRVYVADRLAGSVQVLDGEGAPVRRLGRPGEGPGELRNPVGLAFDADGSLWVVDVGRSRYVVYDTTGSFVTERPRQIVGWGWPWDGGFDRRGRLCDPGIIPGREPVEAFFCRRAPLEARESVDTLPLAPVTRTVVEIRSPEGQYAIGLPHARRREARITGGRLWVGFTDRYRIAIGDDAGARRIVEREVAPDPLLSGERSAIVDSLADLGATRGEVEERLSKWRAMFETFVSDSEGRLWILRSVRGDRLTIDLFDSEGWFVGTVPVDCDATPRPVVKGGSMWVVRSDPLGVQHVLRLRVTVPAGKPAPAR